MDAHMLDNWQAQAQTLLMDIVNKRLHGMVRLLDMQMFRFGGCYSRVSKFGPQRGKSVEVPEYSLHVQCPWRITQAGRIIVGQDDRMFPALPSIHQSTRDGARPSGYDTLLEQRVSELRELYPTGLRVSRVNVNALVGLDICFEDDFSLSVCPTCSNSADDCELWRFSTQVHSVVVYPDKVELQPRH
jgi:hypothetical protein